MYLHKIMYRLGQFHSNCALSWATINLEIAKDFGSMDHDSMPSELPESFLPFLQNKIEWPEMFLMDSLHVVNLKVYQYLARLIYQKKNLDNLLINTIRKYGAESLDYHVCVLITSLCNILYCLFKIVVL